MFRSRRAEKETGPHPAPDGMESPADGASPEGTAVGSELSDTAPAEEHPGVLVEGSTEEVRDSGSDPDSVAGKMTGTSGDATPPTPVETSGEIREGAGGPATGEEPAVSTDPPEGQAGSARSRRGGTSETGEPYDLPRIFAIANQKGGVGKTTTSVNLGAALAELGYRVLVVDLDPQGNASTGLGIDAHNVQYSIYDVLMNDTPVEDAVEPTSLKNLFVVPATIDLAGAEIELVPAFSRELKLRRSLHAVRDDYDFQIIDCPPSLGLLTVNGLAAADDVIVPIQCEYYALEGLGQLLRNVSLVRANLNATLEVRGIVLTMYDARTKLADQVERDVRDHFGSKVYRTVVPRTVRLSEAPSFGQPIIVFDSSSRGAIAYRELAKEVSRDATRRVG